MSPFSLSRSRFDSLCNLYVLLLLISENHCLCAMCIIFFQFDCSICVRPTPLANIVRSFLLLSFAIYQLSFSIERYMDDHTTYFTMNFIGKQAKIFTKRNSHTNRTLQQHTYIHIIILSNSHPLFLCHSAFFFSTSKSLYMLVSSTQLTRL